MRNTFFSLVAGFCLLIAAPPVQAQVPVDLKQIAAIKDIEGAEKFIAPLAPMILMKDMNLGPRSNLRVVKEEVSEQPEADYVEVVLYNENIHTIRLTLKGPRGFYKDQRQSSKILFVASGFFTGRGTVKVMDSVENVVIAGYEYPHTPEEIKKRPELIWDTVRLTTAQMAAAMQWLSERNFVNRYEMYSIGVSLGGIFLPSGIRIAQSLGVPVRGAVFAFTGSDLGQVAVDSLKNQFGYDVLGVLKVASQVISLVHNPQIHLPYLHGRFLMISGNDDKIFSAASIKKYEDAIPQPKQVEVLEGGHINIDQTDLIRKTQDMIKNWLSL